MTARLALLALALAACQCEPPPAPPRLPPDTSSVVVVALDAGAPLDVGCAGECANLQRLGCRWYAPTCAQDCEAAKAALAKYGSVLNTACAAIARTCDEVFACR